MLGDYNDPQLLDRSDLDLTQLRRHWQEHHRYAATKRGGTPRSNLDLASAHAREHWRLHVSHRHTGLLTLIRDLRGRKPVGVAPRPEGWFTGKGAVTREEDRAAFLARQRSAE
jgi:hypothetical protein